jgi:hypothetical protein
MAQTNQLIGVIELDTDADLDTSLDENIGQTLRRLRRGDDGTSGHDPAVCDWSETSQDMDHSDSVLVLQADLGRLRCELESELARLLDRLLLCQ